MQQKILSETQPQVSASVNLEMKAIVPQAAVLFEEKRRMIILRCLSARQNIYSVEFAQTNSQIFISCLKIESTKKRDARNQNGKLLRLAGLKATQ
jgi:hypothetical protein